MSGDISDARDYYDGILVENGVEMPFTADAFTEFAPLSLGGFFARLSVSRLRYRIIGW